MLANVCMGSHAQGSCAHTKSLRSQGISDSVPGVQSSDNCKACVLKKTSLLQRREQIHSASAYRFSRDPWLTHMGEGGFSSLCLLSNADSVLGCDLGTNSKLKRHDPDSRTYLREPRVSQLLTRKRSQIQVGICSWEEPWLPSRFRDEDM